MKELGASFFRRGGWRVSLDTVFVGVRWLAPLEEAAGDGRNVISTLTNKKRQESVLDLQPPHQKLEGFSSHGSSSASLLSSLNGAPIPSIPS